jgi:hypothetical protein
MKVTQTLHSGTIVRQEFKDCARFVMFETDDPNWKYATHGGTIWLASYQGQVFGLTCKHILKDFAWHQLCVTDERFGKHIATLHSVHYPSSPRGDAVGTDVVDITIIRFSSSVDARFFKGTTYILDRGTVGTSQSGDCLSAHGALKQKSEITDSTIKPVFAELHVTDTGPHKSDPTLRGAMGLYENPDFEEIAGMSGSPIFNLTQKRLCGMVARGNLKNKLCTLWYFDIEDIMHILDSVIEGRSDADYKKKIRRHAREKS